MYARMKLSFSAQVKILTDKNTYKSLRADPTIEEIQLPFQKSPIRILRLVRIYRSDWPHNYRPIL